MAEAQIIEMTFTKLIFAAKDDSGFAIYATDQKNSKTGRFYTAKTSFLGDKPESLVGVKIAVTGQFENYANKKGEQEEQFVFTEYEIQEDPLFFFLRQMVRGISKNTAHEIIRRFGDDFEDVVSKTPEMLLSVRGVGYKQLEIIKADWGKYKEYLALGKALLPFHISKNMVMKIAAHFPTLSAEKIMAILNTNPYELIEIDGIGFKKADEIALKLGLDPESPVRVEACLMYCFTEKIMGNGHTVATTGTVLTSMESEIEVSLELRRNALVNLERNSKFSIVPSGKKVDSILDNDAMISPSFLLAQERYIMQAATHYGSRPKKDSERKFIVDDIEDYIAKKNAERLLLPVERDRKPLGEQQCEVIRLANTLPGIMAVIGFAGTGKTTTSKAVLGLYESLYGRSNIIACALAGAAANRTKISSGFESMTVASLLMQAEVGSKLPYKVVLLDEAGMIGSPMMYELLKAIDFENGAHLIMLGDTAQIQPIEPGDPLADMLTNNLIPSVTLDVIYRNDDNSVITQFASEIRKGCVPVGYKESYKDFSFAPIELKDRKALRDKLSADAYKEKNDENLTKVQEHILRTVAQRVPAMNEFYAEDDYLSYLYDIQVLSPMNVGLVGVVALNTALQDVFNPHEAGALELKSPSGVVRVRDKVLHLKNKQMAVKKDGVDKEEQIKVYNGQLGVVTSIACDIDGVPSEAEIYFPNEKYTVRYERAEIARGMVDLGWCKTIHKSQGSEYQRVVAPIVMSHYRMLNPKLIYTLWTRAKKYLHIAGHDSAFVTGCKNTQATSRLTCISILAYSDDKNTDVLDNEIKQEGQRKVTQKLAAPDMPDMMSDMPEMSERMSSDEFFDTLTDANFSGAYFSDKREQDSPNFG